MSKFCTNCGAAIDELDTVCPVCHEAVEPAVAPQKDPGTAEQNPIRKVANAAKTNPKKLIVPAVIVVGIVVAAILLFNVVGGSSYTTALDNVIAITLGDASKIEKMAPQEYWDYLDDEYDRDLDDIIEDAEDAMEDSLEELEDQYGDNIKITYKVTKEKELSKRKLEKIAEALDDQYDIAEDSVKKAVQLDLEMTISGSEDDDEEENELTLVQIDKSWYIIRYYDRGDGYSVSFLITP